MICDGCDQDRNEFRKIIGGILCTKCCGPIGPELPIVFKMKGETTPLPEQRHA